MSLRGNWEFAVSAGWPWLIGGEGALFCFSHESILGAIGLGWPLALDEVLSPCIRASLGPGCHVFCGGDD